MESGRRSEEGINLVKEKQRTKDDAEATKEGHLKRLEDISQPSDLEFSPLTEDQQKWLDSKTGGQKKVPQIKVEPIQKMESMEEWRTLVKSKYDNLKQVVEDNLPQLWLPIQFIISIKFIMNIQGVTLPWLGIILGRASSLKTVAIEAFRDALDVFYTDIFTARAFVSNNTAVSIEKLPKIDMLPKIKNKLFLISELSAQFTKKYEDVQETIGIFVRLADGHGLKTNTGAHGERGYGDTYFNMVGAAVDIPPNVYRLLGYLGPKLYFLRLPKMEKNEDQYLKEMREEEYPVKFARVKQALNQYLNAFASCPDMNFEKESNLLRIAWSKDDEEEAYRLIVRLALLLSRLRAVVTLGDTNGYGGTDYTYATVQREDPSRAITQLRNLARGHALSNARIHITVEDVALVIKVVLSTAPIDRVNVFDLMIAHKGKLTTTIIEDSLNMSDQTARKTITELKAIELVDKPIRTGSSHELEIRLTEKFNWFVTEEFARLRDGFKPQDNRTELDKGKISVKEKIPPSLPMYECPRCSVKNADPTEITEHLESFHGFVDERTRG